MFPLPRILYAMSCDGLLYRIFSDIHPKYQTPLLATLLSGLLAGKYYIIVTIIIIIIRMIGVSLDTGNTTEYEHQKGLEIRLGSGFIWVRYTDYTKGQESQNKRF